MGEKTHIYHSGGCCKQLCEDCSGGVCVRRRAPDWKAICDAFLFVQREPPCWAQDGVPCEAAVTARASAQSRERTVNKAFKGLIRTNPRVEKEMFNYSLLCLSVWGGEKGSALPQSINSKRRLAKQTKNKTRLWLCCSVSNDIHKLDFGGGGGCLMHEVHSVLEAQVLRTLRENQITYLFLLAYSLGCHLH